MRLEFWLLCAAVVAVIATIADLRRRRIVAVQRAFDDDEEVAAIVSRTGHLRLAVETRGPLREANGVAETAARWVFAAPLRRRLPAGHDLRALRTPEAVVAFDALAAGGVVDVEASGSTLRAVLSGVRLREPAEIRQRLLAFVAFADCVDAVVDPVDAVAVGELSPLSSSCAEGDAHPQPLSQRERGA